MRILGYRVKATVVNLQKTWDDLEVRRLLEFVQQNLISDKERQERQKKEEAKRPKDKEGSISCTEVTKISFQVGKPVYSLNKVEEYNQSSV